MDRLSHQIYQISQKIKIASRYSIEPTEVGVLPVDVDWKQRVKSVKKNITQPIGYRVEDVIIDPIGTLTDPDIKDLPIVKSMRRDGKYAIFTRMGIIIVDQSHVNS